MKLLDLFCAAGGGAMGYSRAGFDDIVGVDNLPQKHYPFQFIQADALEYLANHGHEYDAIHASPPCQGVTFAANQWRSQGRVYPELLEPTRDLMVEVGRPYIIEQPVGRVLINPILLNGAMFSLRVKRDRYFETNFPIDFVLLPQDERPTHFGRPFDARKGEIFYPVGHFSGVAEARMAMGIDWMTGAELSQAIPPAYTEFIGKALLSRILD